MKEQEIIKELYYALDRLERAQLQKIPTLEEENELAYARKAARVLLDKYEDEA